MFEVFFMTFLLFAAVIMIPIVAMAIDRAKEHTTEQLKQNVIHDFTPDKKVINALYVDTSREKWAIPDVMPDKTYAVTAYTKIYNFDDIVSYSLLEDNKTITKGGASIGKAVVGGVLFGGVGAIIGGTSGNRTSESICKSLSIKITLRNSTDNCIYIDFVKNGNTMRRSDPQEVLSLLDIITKAPNPKPEVSKTKIKQSSAADEIKKYKELLDIGAITQSEYDEKKKQLLKQ